MKTKSKWLSRKFLIAVAAFLASVGTGITGLAMGDDRVLIVGGVCTILSSAIYAAAEAYVDGKAIQLEKEKQEFE